MPENLISFSKSFSTHNNRKTVTVVTVVTIITIASEPPITVVTIFIYNLAFIQAGSTLQRNNIAAAAYAINGHRHAIF